jgi:putative transcriptional regulator
MKRSRPAALSPISFPLRFVEELGLSVRAALACCLFLVTGFAPDQPAALQEKRYLAGRLLVATEEMRDQRFVETVLYVVSHDQRGAMALVLNRPLARRRISELLHPPGSQPGVKESEVEITLHYGGPVEPTRGFVLHTDDYRSSNTSPLPGGIALTGDPEILRVIARGQGPRRTFFAFGYAGWAPGQLEGEMKKNAWFEIPVDEELIFGADWERKWQRAIDKRKIDL